MLTAVDLWSKQWALDTLSVAKASAPPVCEAGSSGHVRMQREPVDALVLVEGQLELRYAENCGAAFGMLRTAPSWLRTSFFTVAALGFMTLLMWTYVRGDGGRLFVVAVPAIMSGALGNLFDRVHRGFVVDFIRYHGLFEWPTFNVADIAISVGGALLLIDGFGSRMRASSTEPRSERAAT